MKFHRCTAQFKHRRLEDEKNKDIILYDISVNILDDKIIDTYCKPITIHFSVYKMSEKNIFR